MLFTFPQTPSFECSVVDTLWATDEWGYGLEFEILRADHELAKAFDEAHPENGFAAIQTRAHLAHAMGAKSVDVIEGLSRNLESAGGIGFQNDMEAGKRKLAMVLIRNWRGIGVDGVLVDFEAQTALNLLGFRGVAYREKGDRGDFGQWEYLTAGEWTRKQKGGGSLVKKIKLALEAQRADSKARRNDIEVIEFTGEHRDEKGAVRSLPSTRPKLDADGRPELHEDGRPKLEPVPYGGYPFGQALALWLLDKSVAASAIFAKQVAGDSESFEPTPDTALDSGEPKVSSAPTSANDASEESSPATPAA